MSYIVKDKVHGLEYYVSKITGNFAIWTDDVKKAEHFSEEEALDIMLKLKPTNKDVCIIDSKTSEEMNNVDLVKNKLVMACKKYNDSCNEDEKKELDKEREKAGIEYSQIVQSEIKRNKANFLKWKIQSLTRRLDRLVNASDIRITQIKDDFYGIEVLIGGNWTLADVIESSAWDSNKHMTINFDNSLSTIDLRGILKK